MYQVTNRAPDYQVTDTDWGTMYCAYRPAEDDKTYWRFAHFGFPFWTFIPQGDFIDRVHRARLGADGRHAHDVRVVHLEAGVAHAAAGGRQADPGCDAGAGYQPNTTDWYRPLASGAERGERLPDRSRGAAERRDLHRHHAHRDAGPGDHREHGRDRRSLVRASGAERSDDHAHAAAAADGGAGLARERRGAAGRGSIPDIYRQVRSGEAVLAADDWQAAYRDRLPHVVRPTGWREAAE